MSKQKLTIKNVTLESKAVLGVFNESALIQLTEDVLVFVNKKWLHKVDNSTFSVGIVEEFEYSQPKLEGEVQPMLTGKQVMEMTSSLEWKTRTAFDKLFK